ncbi:hypothetical protein MHU86_9754 [Fragilaria crotonensis]|nr:hypothetical protein MHU86_9754 [Fragilaria crotonensis]
MISSRSLFHIAAGCAGSSAALLLSYHRLRRDRWVTFRRHPWSSVRYVYQSLAIYQLAWRVDRIHSRLVPPVDAMAVMEGGEEILSAILASGPDTFQSKPSNRAQIHSLMDCVSDLVQHVRRTGVTPILLDLGAGKALFTRAIYEALGRQVSAVAMDLRGPKVRDHFYDPPVRIDDGHDMRSADASPGEDNDPRSFTRVVADVHRLSPDGWLPQDGGRQPGSIVAMTKHLCGGATDGSIRALCNPPLTELVGACCPPHVAIRRYASHSIAMLHFWNLKASVRLMSDYEEIWRIGFSNVCATDGNCASVKNEDLLGRVTSGCNNDATSCGLWFAKSSIPNSGLGMYAGRNFDKGEHMMVSGDIVIPIVDMEMHQGDNWIFLWDSYTWDLKRHDNDGLKGVCFASPGFGSAANSFSDLHNVDEMKIDHSLVGLQRTGAGAFTPYHNRKSIASVSIPAGQELFVHYGDSWFYHRVQDLGPIPTTGDLPKANTLLTKWDSLRRQHEGRYDPAFKDLWKPLFGRRRTATLQKILRIAQNWEETEQVLQMGLVNLRKQQSTRSLEWLQEHGICADNLRGCLRDSSGWTRCICDQVSEKGAIVAPLPLVHILIRKRFEMFQPDFSVGNVVNKTTAVGQQLLINYCFGHRHSTMLLCPYGLLTGLINHARTPNVKLRWSDPKRSAHSPEWLNKTVEEFAEVKFSVLSMELVAIRDIEPDEEVVLDYGEEWEAA